MAWTDLSNAFGAQTQLTALQMQALRDNVISFANGNLGCPVIQRLAFTASELDPTDMTISSAGYVDIAHCISATGTNENTMRLVIACEAKSTIPGSASNINLIGYKISSPLASGIFDVTVDLREQSILTSFQYMLLMDEQITIPAQAFNVFLTRVRGSIGSGVMTIKNIHGYLIRV